MELMLFGHIIADFYAQTSKISDRKKKSVNYMLLHGIIYMVIMFIVLIILTGTFLKALTIALIIAFMHMGVDFLKIKAEQKIQAHKYSIFLADQVIHVLVLLFICYIFRNSIHTEIYASLHPLGITSGIGMIVILNAALICAKPAAILVSLVFQSIPQTIARVNKREKEDVEQEESAKIGSWIGMLEREIILILGLLGQYGAIGFVLAAKSIARYKQLEEKEFAEKYLVGTLLSALIAILCVVGCALLQESNLK